MPRATSGTPNSDFIVDDARTDLIQYNFIANKTDSWFSYGPPIGGGPIDAYYNSTFSLGANGTSFDFEFTGTRVAVYGGYGKARSPDKASFKGQHSIYSINGTHNFTYTEPFSATDEKYVEYYQSDPLPLGTHKLHVDIITELSDDYYMLDWIEYNVTEAATSTSSSMSSTSSPNPTLSVTSSSSSLSSTSPSPSTVSPSSAFGRSTDLGAAFGTSLGGFVLLILAMVSLHVV